MKSLFTILAIIFTLSASAQRDNYLSFEALGSGGFGSLNYELKVLNTDLTDLHFRSGFSFMPIDKNNGTVLIFPLMLHTTIGKGSHLLDVGLGQSLSVTNKGSIFLRMPFSAGYRLEPQEKRYYFRVSYTPLISYIYNFQWEHWGGITFGYKFRQ